MSDSSDLRQSISRQTSFEHSPEEEQAPVQSVTISKSEEIGVFSEGIHCTCSLFLSSVGCKWSRDGHRFAAGGGEGTLSVYSYDAESQKSELFSCYTCGSELICLDWGYEKDNAANLNLILYGTQEGGLGLLNAANNNTLHETTIEGASSVVAVNFSPLMNSYCSSVVSKNASLLFWDLATQNRVLDANMGVVNCMEYIPTGNGVFCGCTDGHVRLFDIRSGKVVSDEVISSEPISGLRLVMNSATEQSSLFTCSLDGILREHDIRNTSKVVCQYPLRKSVATTMIPHADIVYSPSSRLVGVAANHLEGLSLFNRGNNEPLLNDSVVKRLSFNLDIHPTDSTIIAGTTECSLEMIAFATLYPVSYNKHIKGLIQKCSYPAV